MSKNNPQMSELAKVAIAFTFESERLKKKSDMIRSFIVSVHNSDLKKEDSVAHEIDKLGIDVRILGWLRMKDTRILSNFYTFSRIVYDEHPEYEDYDDPLHLCQGDNCTHREDFFKFLLQNFKATSEVKKILREWKELGEPDDGACSQPKFDPVLLKLDIALQKDRFKIPEKLIKLL
jgi:hypothetical protein